MPNVPLPPLAKPLETIVHGHLHEALQQFLKRLREAVMDQDLRSSTSQDLQACEDFLRFCNLYGAQAIGNTCSAIAQGLTQPTSNWSEHADKLSEWRLVGDDEVDDLLSARRMARQLRESLGSVELTVCRCLNRLHKSPMLISDNPLSLDFLVRRLQVAFRLRGQPLSVRRLFQEQVGSYLGELLQPYFKALAEAFESHGVTPLHELARPVRTERGAHPLRTQGQAAYDAVQQLRQTLTSVRPSTHELRPDLHSVSPREALLELREQPPPGGGWDPWALLQSLNQLGCQLSEHQREDTQLVTEVFQALNRSPNLAPALKPALQRLLLPVLSATLDDSGAIANRNHPVRVTLDRLLRLCDYCEPPNKVLEARLLDLVNRIVGEADRGDGVFLVCDSELDELSAIQQRAYRRSAERLKQLHRGRDLLENAQREVQKALAGIYGDPTPKLLLDWLEAGWRDLLVHDWLCAPGHNHAWSGDLGLTQLLADRLREAARSANGIAQRGYAYQIEHLLKVLRKRMDEFSAGNVMTSHLIGRLERQLSGAEPVEWTETPGKLLELPASAPVPARLQRWRERVEALNEGDCLKTREGQRLQLIWGNPQMDHYVLADAQGIEVGSYGLAELCGMLADGILLVSDRESDDESLVQITLQDIVGRLYGEIAHARSHDELTGLHNRRSFEAAMARSLSSDSSPAFILAHIDQFSLINGHAGPLAGDACLRQLSECLQQCLPGASCLARIGGVEFAAILPGCEERRAAELAEGLRAVAEAKGFTWEGQQLGVTLSIGVVEANATRHDVSNLLCDLQAACTAAKVAGRNRVHCFSMSTDDAAIGLQAIAARVDDIVEREDLSLRVQQIAPAAADSEELPHYELLLVMQNDLLLQDFIAAAERYQRMNKVDRWVLRRIFAELARQPQIWSRCSGLSINLSGCSLNDDKLLGFIESLFERFPVDPRRICFELTETAAVANLAKTADLVRHLQRIGCTFSLDDFGVGFSSFDYLKRLPVDYVKIDGSFVKEIARSRGDLAMVRSINEVAHALGRRTVAEYVETPAIRQQLLEMGVDYVQGYGVQKPVMLDRWLRQETTPA